MEVTFKDNCQHHAMDEIDGFLFTEPMPIEVHLLNELSINNCEFQDTCTSFLDHFLFSQVGVDAIYGYEIFKNRKVLFKPKDMQILIKNE